MFATHLFCCTLILLNTIFCYCPIFTKHKCFLHTNICYTQIFAATYDLCYISRVGKVGLLLICIHNCFNLHELCCSLAVIKQQKLETMDSSFYSLNIISELDWSTFHNLAHPAQHLDLSRFSNINWII